MGGCLGCSELVPLHVLGCVWLSFSSAGTYRFGGLPGGGALWADFLWCALSVGDGGRREGESRPALSGREYVCRGMSLVGVLGSGWFCSSAGGIGGQLSVSCVLWSSRLVRAFFWFSAVVADAIGWSFSALLPALFLFCVCRPLSAVLDWVVRFWGFVWGGGGVSL